MATTTLNPNAPLFVPLAYRMVEDFSDDWWALVKTSPWFRDYWLQECYTDDSVVQDDINDDLDVFLPEDESDLFVVFSDHQKVEEDSKEMILRGMKWNRRVVAEIPKYAEKVPKNVNVKVSPRMIHQPR